MNIFNVLVFVIEIISITTYGWILRLRCNDYAVFDYIETNAILQGSVITTLKNKSAAECESECMNDFSCKSINTENGGERACELNSESASDPMDDVKLSAKAGWTFRSTNYTDILVGKICKDLNPCGLGNLCMDSCECPGYTCHRCPLLLFGFGCDTNPIAMGIESKDIHDYQMSAKTTKSYLGETYRSWQARLNGPSAWRSLSLDMKQFLRVDFARRKIIGAIAVQGLATEQAWVKKYKLNYTEDGYSWKTYQEYGKDKILDGCTDSSTVAKQELSVGIRTFAIAINPQQWQKHICMKIELYGFDDPQQPKIPVGCVNQIRPLGMASGVINDDQITASSSDDETSPSKARLNEFGNNWCAQETDTNPYLQIDLRKNMIIVGIAVQGKNYQEKWVTKYQVDYKTLDETSYKKVLDTSSSQSFNFKGTTGRDIIAKSKVDPAIKASVIRLRPLEYHGAYCLRAELYGCEISL